jgi:thioester reductase-like protein
MGQAPHYFVTGATGTIGSALLPRLLRDPTARLTLLIRARDDADLTARKLTLLGSASADPGARARVSAVRGDITRPGLGLSQQDQDGLAATATHIIHCAASVKLNMSAVEASATAVAPTRALLALGRQGVASGVLRKMELVSTVGVWGRTPGLMPERPLPEVDSFHNTYEAAKAEAERVIWAEGQGLPITVHRPSMVVGESGSGHVIHFQVFYHLCEFLSGVRTFGIMPALGSTRLDTVPVDWVADAIHWSSGQAATAGRILHLCSGPERSLPLDVLQTRVRDCWQSHGIHVPRLRRVERRWLERAIPVIGALAGARTRRALRGLSPVLAYLAEDQGFTNVDTLVTLERAGLPLPDVDQYLTPVLDYYLRRRQDRTAR